MLHFATQTVMALPLQMLHNVFKHDIITDGKQHLKIEFEVDEFTWSVKATKVMYLNKSQEYIEMVIIYDSNNDSVVIAFENV